MLILHKCYAICYTVARSGIVFMVSSMLKKDLTAFMVCLYAFCIPSSFCSQDNQASNKNSASVKNASSNDKSNYAKEDANPVSVKKLDNQITAVRIKDDKQHKYIVFGYKKNEDTLYLLRHMENTIKQRGILNKNNMIYIIYSAPSNGTRSTILNEEKNRMLGVLDIMTGLDGAPMIYNECKDKIKEGVARTFRPSNAFVIYSGVSEAFVDELRAIENNTKVLDNQTSTKKNSKTNETIYPTYVGESESMSRIVRSRGENGSQDNKSEESRSRILQVRYDLNSVDTAQQILILQLLLAILNDIPQFEASINFEKNNFSIRYKCSANIKNVSIAKILEDLKIDDEKLKKAKNRIKSELNNMNSVQWLYYTITLVDQSLGDISASNILNNLQNSLDSIKIGDVAGIKKKLMFKMKDGDINNKNMCNSGSCSYFNDFDYDYDFMDDPWFRPALRSHFFRHHSSL